MPTNSSLPQALPYWRLSSFYFFYFCVVGALAPYWGVYLKSIGYSSQDVGVISAVILGTRIVAPNFWGWLADKTQQRLRIIRLGSAIACICFTGVFIRQDYLWLLIVITTYTFFWHAVLPQFEVITLRYLADNHQGYSRIRLWGSIGFIAAVVGLGALFDHISVNYLPVAIFSFLLLIGLSSMSLREQSYVKTTENNAAFLTILLRPEVLIFLFANFLLQVSHGPYYTYYTLFLKENHGYSGTASGLLWALGVIAEIGIFMIMPRLMHRFSVRVLLLSSFLVTAVRWLLIGYCAQWLWVLLFAQLLHGFSFGVAHAASIDIIRRWFKGTHQGQGQALYSSFSFGAGGASGALLAAFWWDHNASLTFLIASASVFLAFVFTYFGLHLKKEP